MVFEERLTGVAVDLHKKWRQPCCQLDHYSEDGTAWGGTGWGWRAELQN